MNKIKNIAIIAHVDHGKTTLIDSLLKQTGAVQSHQQIQVRAMDSNDLEKERGITILAKCTSIKYKEHLINIMDTPGHADFGGEVERVLGMVDGAIVLVDAAEGPLPQTKFVLSKALKLNIKPIVVINKVDRKDARVKEVLDEVYELFLKLNATDEQLNFQVLYASGRDGWCSLTEEKTQDNLYIMLDKLIEEFPDAAMPTKEPFKMLATILEVDSYLGVLLTGKVETGILKVNQMIKALDLNGELIENARVTKILMFDGLNRIPVEEISAGNICIVAGFKKATVTNTLCDQEVIEPIKAEPVDPPTLSINISVNDSPMAGKEGKKCTSRMLAERLFKEMEKNIALKVVEESDGFKVSGRGELHLGVLIETMRREGFEMNISKPKVVLKVENGKTLEPIEELTIDLDEEYVGIVIEKLSKRKGIMDHMDEHGHGRVRLIMNIPTRGLIGYHSEFLTDTKGTGLINKCFKNYEEYKGEIVERVNGSLISNADGISTAYAIFNLEDRGNMFITPGEQVYEGMIIGEHSKENDLEVNVIKAKQLTNVRAAGKDDATKCRTPMPLSIEFAMSYLKEDELLEITPKNLRLRKKYLKAVDRKRNQK